MSERDELARELFIGDNSNQSRQQSIIDWEWLSRGHMEHGQYKMMADAILAAGWTKPRTVTTMEELDAMPRHSVIRTHQDEIYTKHYDYYEESDNWEARDRASIHFGDLPATVLYAPELQP